MTSGMVKVIESNVRKCEVCDKCSLPAVTAPEGNLDSDILFLITCPTMVDVGENAFFRHSAGKLFRYILKKVCHFNVFEEALVLPLTFCHFNKISQKKVDNCSRFTSVFMEHYKVIVICGNDVYKHYFKQGKMPELLCGSGMKIPGHKQTFFFFSDYIKLDYKTDYSEYWFEKFKTEARGFKKFLIERKEKWADE